jgi:hypothetical protein
MKTTFFGELLWTNQPISEEQITTLFSYIEDIFSENEKLLSKLRGKAENWSEGGTTTGDVFENMVSILGYEFSNTIFKNLERYMQYVVNYNTRCAKTLNEIRTNPQWMKFKKVILIQ